MLVSPCCSTNTGMSIYRCQFKNITYEFVITFPAMLRICCSSLRIFEWEGKSSPSCNFLNPTVLSQPHLGRKNNCFRVFCFFFSIIMAGTVSSKRPYGSWICSISPQCLKLNVLAKSVNSYSACFFFFACT